jgi:hypothetical protein
MTFLEWFCDVEFTGRSKDLAEMAYNAAKADDAMICNTYGKETKGNMHKSLAAFECAKLIKRSMK